MIEASYRTSSSEVDIQLVEKMLSGLEQFYPDFDQWYITKVIPSLKDGSGGMILAEIASQIVGVAISKISFDKKFRCLRVIPEYRNSGIGHNLISKTLRLLNCDKPLVTVPQEMIHDLARPFVNDFKFELKRVEKGLYRENILEYIFNEEI